jgi:hypothetical protein
MYGNIIHRQLHNDLIWKTLSSVKKSPGIAGRRRVCHVDRRPRLELGPALAGTAPSFAMTPWSALVKELAVFENLNLALNNSNTTCQPYGSSSQ